jgi:hypothetical protein
MTKLRKTWIVPFLAGAISTLIGVALLAFLHARPADRPDTQLRDQPASIDTLSLPPAFKFRVPSAERDRLCYRIVSDCLKEKEQQNRVGRPTNGCEILPSLFREFQAAKYSLSQSALIGGCIVGMQAETHNEWKIFDLQGALSDVPLLFNCDRSGVDNVIVSEALRLEGKLRDEPYRIYLDNAEGGNPRTLETPTAPYSRDRCRSIFERRFRELASAGG